MACFSHLSARRFSCFPFLSAVIDLDPERAPARTDIHTSHKQELIDSLLLLHSESPHVVDADGRRSCLQVTHFQNMLETIHEVAALIAFQCRCKVRHTGHEVLGLLCVGCELMFDGGLTLEVFSVW